MEISGITRESEFGLIPDFTNPAAVKWWKDKVASSMAGCFGIGMSDFGEDTPPMHITPTNVPASRCITSTRCYIRKRLLRRSLKIRSTRGLVNARSGTAGMQRYPICWSADPQCEMGGDGDDSSRGTFHRAFRRAVLE